MNKNSNTGTVSETEESFSIQMEKSDTLIFSTIGFHDYRFTVNEVIKDDQIFIKIN